MNSGPLVVTYPLSERSRAIVAEELGGAAEIDLSRRSGAGRARRSARPRRRVAGP